MIAVSAFGPHQFDRIAALWRALHPDWTWLDDPARLGETFAAREGVDRIAYLVESDGTAIASVFATLRAGGPRNRYIDIAARPRDIGDWLDPLLAQFAEADRGAPGTWHIASIEPAMAPVLAPRLLAAGFAHRTTSLRMAWEGERIAVVDPAPARLERYAGGDASVDAALAALHARAYGGDRLVSPMNLAELWTPWPGLGTHEFVLAREGERIVGYAEWFVVNGQAYIHSFVAARSHWGTPVGAAVGTKAMELLLGLGHHKIESSVASTNAPSLALHRKHGWRVAGEMAQTYVRAL